MMLRPHFLLSLLLFVVPGSALFAAGYTATDGAYTEREDVQAFMERFSAENDYDPASLKNLLLRAEPRQDILDLISRPAEGKPWHEYRKIFLTEKRIAGGETFYKEHLTALAQAEEKFGVPGHIITAIIGVETLYGKHKGRHRVVDALATLGFDYPPRAKFFKKELEHYLILAKEERIDPFSIKGSYAGAMGIGQFMPSSYRHYAIDFDGDESRDLWHNPVDAIGSVANYFKEHKWKPGGAVTSKADINTVAVKDLVRKSLKPDRTVGEFQTAGIKFTTPAAPKDPAMLIELDQPNSKEHWIGLHNFYVITRYNHSALYAMAVYQLSEEIRKRVQ